MIKFKLNTESKTPSPKNQYELNLKFMYGDADGYETETFKFDETKLADQAFRQYLTEFVKHLDECIKLDSSGRGGFDCAEECLSHYGESMGWTKFCATAVEQLDADDLEEDGHEPYMDFDDGNIFTYNLPTQDGIWFASYRSLKIKYYDELGNIFDVTYEL